VALPAQPWVLISRGKERNEGRDMGWRRMKLLDARDEGGGRERGQARQNKTTWKTIYEMRK